MNKGKQFWADLWRTGRTSFHKEEVNPDLISYWPELNLAPDATVLVPLCGKSLDMLWLSQQGYYVIGIELCEQAVLQFASEHQLVFQQRNFANAMNYYNDVFSIWVADVFTLDTTLIPPVDAIYDRGALIALPAALRPVYVTTCFKWLKSSGSILLKTMTYNQREMEGPPYSVTDDEITHLYKNCEINYLKSTTNTRDSNDPLFARGVRMVNDKVWFIRNKE
ncbi:thiopurine S-methyltransferase [uncultured Legionella sp.]|uniref:thiopurine S-methyltransferase n=1 Tax=uncultured Legionella sp. TaxID=210934 RepID=UPI00260FC2F4|nr:thiopurine S-methyltransferase [uncultured Legionella sp.]